MSSSKTRNTVGASSRRSVSSSRPVSSTRPAYLSAIGRWNGTISKEWLMAVARILLGAVLLWFGYHELTAPLAWTGYVPVLHPNSSISQLLVLAHGWLLFLLGVALVAGIAPRLSALVAAVLLFEIVISLAATGGFSDLVLRDVGVLGLALAVTGAEHNRLVMRW